MPHEQTRKIIRVGNSLAVTMPKAWLRYFNLTDKDRVEVVSNERVVIKPMDLTSMTKSLSSKKRVMRK